MRYKVCVTVAMVAVLIGVLVVDRGALVAEAAQYCEMVKLGKDSNGDLGWPDFHHRYEQQCTADGKLREELK